MKRVLTIQDISCLGKCSITIALPVLSAIGIETVILPTALLSNHTLFKEYTKLDLSDQMMPIARMFKKNGAEFDAIYTGYLGTTDEIEKAAEIIDIFRGDDTLVFVDPVMGDNGKLYRGFSDDYAALNTKLCAKADLVVPNITEACLMTGAQYRESYDESYLSELCVRLCAMGAKKAVITGASLSEGKTGVYGMDAGTGETFIYQNDKVSVSYHGTGDLFSSIAVGALIRGIGVRDAMMIAADHTADTIRATLGAPGDPWYGVDFETTIPDLIGKIRDYEQENGSRYF